METASQVLVALGIAELVLGAALLGKWRARWPFAVILALMPVALLGLAITSPGAVVGAFNPVALNVAVAALAAVAWLTNVDLPSASRCLRARPGDGSGVSV